MFVYYRSNNYIGTEIISNFLYIYTKIDIDFIFIPQLKKKSQIKSRIKYLKIPPVPS